MCGRFTLRTSAKKVAKAFDVPEVPELFPRFNIAPTQPVAVVRRAADRPERELASLRWGLIPSWSEDAKTGARMINARSETAADLPAFRNAFRRRRCLIVADGFYEWQKLNGKKQPYFIHLKDDQPFAFAGLWESWRIPDKQHIESCTILTTEANDLIRFLHDRMPVILRPADYDRWLDPAQEKVEELSPLLQPLPSEEMSAEAVSSLVNNARNEDPKCIEPLPRNLFGDPDPE